MKLNITNKNDKLVNNFKLRHISVFKCTMIIFQK